MIDSRDPDKVLLGRLEKELRSVIHRFTELEKEINDLFFKIYKTNYSPRMKIVQDWRTSSG